MSWSRVQGNSGHSTTTVSSLGVALGSPTPSGNLVVVSVEIDIGSASTPGVTDSAGNTYTKIVSNGAINNCQVSIWATVVTVPGTLTITASSSTAAFLSIDVSEYNGGTTADGNVNNSGSGTALSAGTITPTGTDLIVCAGAAHVVGSYTIGSGFSTSSNLSGGGSNAGFCVQYALNQSSALACSMTSSGSASWGCVAAAWKASGASIIVPFWHLFQGSNHSLADTP